MVKLRVAARVIPEDAYLASLKTGDHGHIEGEKKFAVIVREPEDCYIGTLALDIQESYKRRYKYDLGKIKYLKADDDCDLDPEDLVADQLVDEGKAARDGTDQNITVKVIQEQGRAVRLGSVVPDLTPVHYRKPLSKPPVPLFSDVPSTLGKRDLAEPNSIANGGHAKRVRMDGIAETEEEDTIVTSIEGDQNMKTPELVIQDSQGRIQSPREPGRQQRQDRAISPELGTTWQESPTVTAEVDTLPEMPAFLEEPARIAKTSPILPPDLRANASRSPGKSPAAAAVSMLNGMKSVSPALGRSSSSASAARFRNPPGTVQVHLDPDIDDSQMSPRSRAATNKITPRLVSSTKRIATSDGSNSIVSIANGNRGANEEGTDGQNQVRALQVSQSPETTSENGSSNAQDTLQEKKKPPKQTRKRKRRSEKNDYDDTNVTVNNTASQGRGKKTGETDDSLKKRKPDERTEYEVDESSSDVDSPGAQLSQALQEYTPRTGDKSFSLDVPEESSTVQKIPADASKKEKMATAAKSQKSKSSQEKKTPKTAKLKCLTCWTDKTACDNQIPKCSSCTKRGRFCQEYALNTEQADKTIKERREIKAQNAKKKAENKKLSPAGSKTTGKQSPEKTVSALPNETQVLIGKPSNGLNDVSSSVAALKSADKGKLTVPLNEQTRRSQSIDSQGPRTVILPPGMTQQQYDEMVKNNSALTEEQRKEQKKSLQKKNSALALKKTPSRESEDPNVGPPIRGRDKSTSESTSTTSNVSKKQATPNANDKATSSTPTQRPSIIPAETRKDDMKKSSTTKPTPSRASAQSASKSTPATALSKKNSTPLNVTPSSKNNPPFKQPGLKSNKVAESVPLSNLKSVAELGARLSAQSSTANSPRPSINLGKNLTRAEKNNSSFLDNDDDDSSDSDSGSDSEDESSSTGNGKQQAAKALETKVNLVATSPGKNATSATPTGKKTTLESSSSDDDSSTETASESSDDDDS